MTGNARDRIVLRDATASELPALNALCFRSKASWGYDASFMERCRSVLMVTADQLSAWHVRVACDRDGTLLGLSAASVERADSENAELELMFVDPPHFRRSVGRALLEDVRASLSARGVSALWILSDPGALPFYLATGAVVDGHRPSDAIDGRHLPWLRLSLQSEPSPLTTQRLLLRPFRDSDADAFARLNADERVATFLPSTLDRDQSDAFLQKIRQRTEQQGFGLLATERVDIAERPMIGFIGLNVTPFYAPFTPSIEIGWRLAPEHWGLGLAPEGAAAVLQHAFDTLRLDEVVSFTVPHNTPSRRVMEKIGMVRDPHGDFDHPLLPEGHALRRHVLYRTRAPSSDPTDAKS
jgi:ribosomal-protein-alanine N-acetyltransferase